MAKADTQNAIGAATSLLREHLIRRGFGVSVGKPEQAAANDSSAKLNLFLYETVFDASLRNHRVDPDSAPPIWLSLRYLLTAFDDEENSDSSDAHSLLGRGMMALQEMNFLGLDPATPAAVQQALEHSPEPLKITFEESSPELLSKLMQGTDETYRLSAAFLVRPIMLLPSEPPRSSLLVGIDYSIEPSEEIGEAALGIEVIPSMGASIERIEPAVFDIGEEITIHGTDLHLEGLTAMLGDEPLRVTGQWADRITAEAESPAPGLGPVGRFAAGLGPSAGEHPIKLVQERAGGRLRSSNLVTGKLRPRAEAATIGAGDLEITGALLGSEADDVIIAMLRDGEVVHAFDTVTSGGDQTGITVIDAASALSPGTYRALVKVNGVQSRTAPQVQLS